MHDKKDLLGLTAGMYLRKSRNEEKIDTQDLLQRHRKSLEECAQRHGLQIQAVFPEVVSGESLYARPQMLRLMEEVEAGKFDAILCMDIDRLSRGRMRDQGIILDTLKDSGTLIVTPEKVYDLSDEIDDELAEFKTFMSRREYKIINKRLRRGLKQTIQSGGYIANAPYGYKKTTIDRKPTLEIYEPEARFVRMMFQLYADGFGCVAIAHQMAALGARPHRSDTFNRTSIAKILRNPTYIGKIVWDQKTHIRKNTRGNPKSIVIYNPPEKWTITDGLHPPIVTKELYDQVQSIMAGRYRPARNDGTIKSPLAGLVYCANCGRHMQRSVQKGEPYLLCTQKGCCASAKFEFVEARILEILRNTLTELEVQAPESRPDTQSLESALAAVRREISVAGKQKSRLHELLEIGEYDLPTYRERMAVVKGKLADLEAQESDMQERLKQSQRFDPAAQASKIRSVLAAYESSDVPHRNALLHSILEKVTYHKEKKTKPMDFDLECILKVN